METYTGTGDIGGTYGRLPEDVPSELMLVTPEGRLFVDLDAFLATMHEQLHVVMPVMSMLRGEDYTNGQHGFAISCDNVARNIYHDAGLVHVFDEEPPDGEPTTSVEDVLNALGGDPWKDKGDHV